MAWIQRLTFICALALIPLRLFAGPAETAHEPARESFRLFARSAILIDQVSGRVLYQRDADQPFVPASLAKLMSLHIVYQKLADRTISRSDVVSLSANAWANHQAPGSTLMNLGPGQIVTVEELMKGMAVASGNDAATALAEYVAGSTRQFVRLMNEERGSSGTRSPISRILPVWERTTVSPRVSSRISAACTSRRTPRP